MPKCVVKGCLNNSSANKKQDGVTFHTFPVRNEDAKEKWIEVIRVSRNEPFWNPTLRSVVCSAHFESDDLYYTSKGLRRVLLSGYPKLILVHLPAPPDQSVHILLNEPTTIKAHASATSIGSTAEDLILPHTSQTHVSATPIELVDKVLMQPHTSQAHISATPIESIIIDVDPIQLQSSQAHVSATPDLSTALVSNVEMEEDESIFDTPRKHKLRQRVLRLEKQRIQMKRKIKTLNQQVRRLKETNKSLR